LCAAFNGISDFLETKNTLLTRSPSYLRTYGIPVYSQIDLNGQKTYMMTAGAAYN
jgi:hypothetical protein